MSSSADWSRCGHEVFAIIECLNERRATVTNVMTNRATLKNVITEVTHAVTFAHCPIARNPQVDCSNHSYYLSVAITATYLHVPPMQLICTSSVTTNSWVIFSLMLIFNNSGMMAYTTIAELHKPLHSLSYLESYHQVHTPVSLPQVSLHWTNASSVQYWPSQQPSYCSLNYSDSVWVWVAF